MAINSPQILKGASRYVVGSVDQFDQKNEVFKRPYWDPSMADMLKKFYHDKVYPKKTPGYRLEDQAAVNASWLIDSRYGKVPNGTGDGLYGWDWDGKFQFPRVPSGLKLEEANPKVLSHYVKNMAAFYGASKTGICALDRRWLYSSAYTPGENGWGSQPVDIPEDCKHAIVVAIEMDYDAIRCSPALPASVATGLAYSRMAFIAGLLAHFIRGLGYRAIPSGNDTACSIPIAIDAGMGEIARNGLLITPEFGPRVRLCKVITDMPLIADQPIEFGVWDFCKICGKCAQRCPSKSIISGDPTPEPHNISNRTGILKWNINAETCLAWWAANGSDCSNCIRVCPFNKPPGLLHDVVRWGIRKFKPLHPFFLWGDDVMGYGKREKADGFWHFPK